MLTLFEMGVIYLPLNFLTVAAYLACHADGDFVRFKQSGDFGNEGVEFQSGANICLALAELHGEGMNVMLSAVEQTLICLGFLHWGDVLPLQVLGDGKFLGFLVRKGVIHYRLYVLPPGYEGCAVSALSVHYLVAVCVGYGAHADCLKHTLTADRVGKLGEALFVELLAWVEAARLNEGEGDDCLLHVSVGVDVLVGCGLNCCRFHN